MLELLCLLLNLYYLALFARIILSWFPIGPGSALVGIVSFLYGITEPVLGPVRRAIPSLGMFDLSPLIVLIGIQIIGSAVLGCRVGVL